MDEQEIIEVDFDDEELQENSVWADVDSESGEYNLSFDEETIPPEEENPIEINRTNPIKPFKTKLNKIYSLFMMVALVIFLAYLDYVNEFQIMKLISNFQITPKSNWADAKNLAKYSSNSAKQVEAVVYFMEKEKPDLQCISDVASYGMERKNVQSRSALYSYFHDNVIPKGKEKSS